MRSGKLVLSPLAHTWVIDVDGTICMHNGYKSGEDKILPGVREFFSQIPPEDYILILTSRKSSARRRLVRFMRNHGLRYDKIVFDMPMGERILINDDKPSGLNSSIAIRKKRDTPLDVSICVDERL